jgi:hypothetical protein
VESETRNQRTDANHVGTLHSAPMSNIFLTAGLLTDTFW